MSATTAMDWEPEFTPMAPRQIALTDNEDKLVDDLVRSGRFRDADEVVREGLRLVAEEAERDYTVEDMRAAAQVGLDDIAAGRSFSFTTEPDLRTHFSVLTEDTLSGKI